MVNQAFSYYLIRFRVVLKRSGNYFSKKRGDVVFV